MPNWFPLNGGILICCNYYLCLSRIYYHVMIIIAYLELTIMYDNLTQIPK